jgi:hypothetical protein
MLKHGKKRHNGVDLDKNQKENELWAQTITELIKQKKPNSVRQLIDLVKAQTSRPEKEIVEQITRLQDQGTIKLEEIPEPTPQTLSLYLRKNEAYWFWITLILSIATTISVLTIAEEAYPLVYIRYVLGLVFILFLPGYAFTRAFFPTHTPFKAASRNLDSVVRIALSIGMSLAIVPVVTLFLDYTPLGVRLTPILLCLLAVTLLFATIGVLREHNILRKKATPTTTEESDVRSSL